MLSDEVLLTGRLMFDVSVSMSLEVRRAEEGSAVAAPVLKVVNIVRRFVVVCVTLSVGCLRWALDVVSAYASYILAFAVVTLLVRISLSCLSVLSGLA